MARGRLISKSLGSSRKFHELLGAGGKLGEFCQLLFPLVIANTDDYGRMAGDAFTIKNLVLPTSRRPEADFEQALQVMHRVGLVVRYIIDDAIYLQVNKFDDHQVNLRKRAASKFPPNDGKVPAEDGHVPLNLIQSKRTESKGTQSNRADVATREADALFEVFWQAYPRKRDKEAARRAWDKRRPTPEFLAAMIAALDVQKTSHDWLKEHGRFIPYPATWLNNARWTDELERDDGLSETARYNLAASDEAEQIILNNEAQRTGTHGHRR